MPRVIRPLALDNLWIIGGYMAQLKQRIGKGWEGRGFGWAPETPDPRDVKYALHMAGGAVDTLPAEVDLRPNCPPITDQGATNSCTGAAWAGLLDYLDPDGPKPFMASSRRFLYWNMCDLGGFAGRDEGAFIRDGAKVSKTLGVPHEIACGFSPAVITRKPKPIAYTQAERRLRAQTYHALYGLDAQLACLAEGFPFVFGFTVFEGFLSAEVARTGVYAMPDLGREKAVGGHAVMAVGYSVPKQQMLVRNSWGTAWGTGAPSGESGGGHVWMPFDLFRNGVFYVDDAWTARL